MTSISIFIAALGSAAPMLLSACAACSATSPEMVLVEWSYPVVPETKPALR